jgi:opacity protein-like surface antigen
METVTRRLVIALVLLVVPVTVVCAQDPPRVTGTIGAMIVPPLSGTADNFSTGWGVDVGATWWLTDQMGVQFDYLYSGLGGKDMPQGTVPVDSSLRMQAGTAAFVFQAPPGAFRLYLLAGAGVYHRSVSLSTSTAGTVSVCNPWWFVCTAQPEPAGNIVGSHASTDLGVNIGVGFTAGRFFAEARYHYMTGPSFSTPTGTQKATGKFFPLIVGARF